MRKRCTDMVLNSWSGSSYAADFAAAVFVSIRFPGKCRKRIAPRNPLNASHLGKIVSGRLCHPPAAPVPIHGFPPGSRPARAAWQRDHHAQHNQGFFPIALIATQISEPSSAILPASLFVAHLRFLGLAVADLRCVL